MEVARIEQAGVAKATLYTLFGSVFMLLAFLAMYFRSVNPATEKCASRFSLARSSISGRHCPYGVSRSPEMALVWLLFISTDTPLAM